MTDATSWRDYEPLLLPLMIHSSTIEERDRAIRLGGRTVTTGCCSCLINLIQCIWNAVWSVIKFLLCIKCTNPHEEGTLAQLSEAILRRSFRLSSLEINEETGRVLQEAGFTVELRERAMFRSTEQLFSWDEKRRQEAQNSLAFHTKLHEYTDRGQTIDDFYREEEAWRYVSVGEITRGGQRELDRYRAEELKDREIDNADIETVARRTILRCNGFCTVEVPLAAKVALNQHLAEAAAHILPLFLETIQ